MTGCRTNAARAICFLSLVLVLWTTQGLDAKKKPPLHPVNLNTASSAELQQVPGIGPSTADKILKARKSYGSFHSVDDLRAIKGIGPKKLDKMRKYLAVSKPPQSTKPAPAAASQSKSPPAKNPPPKTATKPKPPVAPSASEEEEP
jgi:competence ComEA-like helix-hairpin-helix protein